MQLLTSAVLPSNITLALGLLGLILFFRPRWRRAASLLLGLAPVVLLIFSSGKTATALSSPLEYAYVKATPPQPGSVSRDIVVLAAYAADDPNMPLSSRPNSSAMFRIVEAVHLWRACQQCTVIVTGMDPTTKVMAESIAALGVPADRIRIDNGAANTAESAVNVASMLSAPSFYLVTSAGHMPRSMGVFLKQGLQPIPAPTDYLLPKYVSQAEWSPSSLNLYFSDAAMHEHIGLLWYRIRGRI
jgi:uncharacterized SAM-binding protein YcdF (DUF218 family)